MMPNIDKSWFSLMPPPPRCWWRLPQNEREELTDYLESKSQKVFENIMEDARQRCESHMALRRILWLVGYPWYWAFYAIGIMTGAVVTAIVFVMI